jgi:hypothetical protein
MKIALKRLAMGIAGAGMLTIYGCGGGGGSGDVTPTLTSMTLTPSLGQFSKGTIVRLKKLDNSVLSSGSIGDDGKATLTLSGHTGPVVIEVLGGTGVTYYDEGTKTNQPYGGTLRAVVPAPQTDVGVTALTHAAAAGLVLSSTLTTDQIKLANTKVAAIFGYTDGASILQAPTLVKTPTGNALNVATTGDKYALILAALAKTAASGMTKADVVEALASDLKDDKLDGLAGTAPILSYLPATITDNYQEAANDLADDSSQTVIAGAPLVPTTDVSTVVTVSNQSDVDLAKAMFAELRTTLNSFANGSQTGFLNTQAQRMSADLNANVAPEMGRVGRRINALQVSIDTFEDAKLYSIGNTNGFELGLAPGTTTPQVLIRKNGSPDAVWNGYGNWNYCHTDANTAAAVSKVVCSFAGPDSADLLNSRIKLVTFELTRSAVGQYSYTATRYNRGVTVVNGIVTAVGNATIASGVPVGSGTVSQTFDGSSPTGLTVNGTMPPSTDLTGADTIAIAATRTALTAPNFRYALTGSVSTTNNADPAKKVTLSLDTGSSIDLNETTGEPVGGKIVGTAKTVATQFTGSVEIGSFVTNASGQSDPTKVVFDGSISDTSSGGAGQILTGKLEATVTDYQLYVSTSAETSTNFLKAKLTFTGTVQAPSRPLLKLVLAADRTALNSGTVTLNYSYGTNISITGSGIIDEANSANNTMTLSNQAGIQVVTKTGLVTKAGSTAPVATILNGKISYADGVTESLM